MPLALELAAARVGVAVAGADRRAAGRLAAVLTAGSRSALDRQQTLRGHAELEPRPADRPSETLFRRLAVFAGSFSSRPPRTWRPTTASTAREVADLLGPARGQVAGPGRGRARRGYRYRLLEPCASTRASAWPRPARPTRCRAPPARSTSGSRGPPTPRRRPPPAQPASRGRARQPAGGARVGAARTSPSEALRLASPVAVLDGRQPLPGGRALDRRRARRRARADRRARRGAARLAGLGCAWADGRTGRARRRGLAILRSLDDPARRPRPRRGRRLCDMAGRWDRPSGSTPRGGALAPSARRPERSPPRPSHGVLAHCRGELPAARELLLESLALLGGSPRRQDRSSGCTPRPFRRDRGPAGRRASSSRRRCRSSAASTRARDRLRAGRARRRGPRRGRVTPAREGSASASRASASRRPMGTAFALNRLGNLAGATGELDHGREWLEEALAMRRALGDRRERGVTLGNLGVLAARAGDASAAARSTTRRARCSRQHRRRPGLLGCGSISALRADAGDPERARRAARGRPRRWPPAQRLFRCVGWARCAGRAGDRRRRPRARAPGCSPPR